MIIAGKWLVAEDGMPRPVVLVTVPGDGGQLYPEHFLIDSGADRTVFSADFATRLGLPLQLPLSGTGLMGVGGLSEYRLVKTSLEFSRDDGGAARVQGEFAAFTDPQATDLSVLGRDVLNNFDFIMSRRRNEVLLLAPNHQYHISRP
jgi:hypothetical protein